MDVHRPSTSGLDSRRARPGGPAGRGRTPGPSCFQGAYAEVLYFLTGEHRSVQPQGRRAFGRVIPNAATSPASAAVNATTAATADPANAGPAPGRSGVRYSWIDLDNKGIRGGTVHDVTVGLNWFLNPYMKWQWNYIARVPRRPNPRHDGWVLRLRDADRVRLLTAVSMLFLSSCY